MLAPSQGNKLSHTISVFKIGKALVGWGNSQFLVRAKSQDADVPRTKEGKWRGQSEAESEAGQRYRKDAKAGGEWGEDADFPRAPGVAGRFGPRLHQPLPPVTRARHEITRGKRWHRAWHLAAAG